MLFRGLVRFGTLTLATLEFFWDLTVLQKKIKKMSGGRRRSGRHLWSARPEYTSHGSGTQVDSRSEKSKLDLDVPRGFYRVPDHF